MKYYELCRVYNYTSTVVIVGTAQYGLSRNENGYAKERYKMLNRNNKMMTGQMSLFLLFQELPAEVGTYKVEGSVEISPFSPGAGNSSADLSVTLVTGGQGDQPLTFQASLPPQYDLNIDDSSDIATYSRLLFAPAVYLLETAFSKAKKNLVVRVCFVLVHPSP
jgi:hypothetical protein